MNNARKRRLALAPIAAVAASATIVVLGGAEPAAAARATATCRNTSTDAAAIQSVINSSAAGDEIVIDGPCLITQTITLLGDRAYRGDSAATTLTEASGANLPAVLASDSWVNNSSTTGDPITLRDLSVEANGSGNPSGGDAVIIRSWNTDIENLHISDAKNAGLRITNESKNGTALTNTQVNGTVRGLFITGSGGSGVYVEDSGNSVTDWNLIDNWVAYSGGDAIRLENSAGWPIERNHVYGVGSSGIDADRLFGTSLDDNYVEDFKDSGIEVSVQGDAASTVSGNKIFQFGGSGGTTYLAVNQVNYGSGYLTVVGNTIRGNGTGVGLSYQQGGHQLTVTSSGNMVTGVTTPKSAGSGVTVSAGI